MRWTTGLFLCLFYLAKIAQAQEAAVAMPDRHSADSARSIMNAGGNAVDAAIAAAFTLAVTYPEAGNIGGGGFMLSVMDGETAFLDFRETAPGAATADMYLDENGSVQGRQPLVGALAAGVPGTVRGLREAHRRYGSLPWASLLRPAIVLARDGFEPPSDLVELALSSSEFFAGETNFDAYFSSMAEDATFRQPQLAETLDRLALDPEDFYEGLTAERLIAQMQKSGGLISAQDLRDYSPQWREPLHAPWRSYEVVTAPPPSSGGIALFQLLALRDLRDGDFRAVEHNSTGYVHLLAELYKRAFADRAEYLGDPDFFDVPVNALLDSEYLARRAAGVNIDTISPVEEVTPGLEHPDTTHFSILDTQGNAVSLTYTLNWDFGCGVVVEGAGFLLNNEMDDFSAAPGVPNEFGVIGGSANAIAPHKRMLSSMTPSLMLQDGEVAAVLGTPGGSTIFTSVFQVILNIFDQGMSAENAVNALRFHHQLPQALLIRHDQRPIPADTLRGLQALGYTVEANDWGDLGDVQLILHSATGTMAASDNRGRGVARVFEADN